MEAFDCFAMKWISSTLGSRLLTFKCKICKPLTVCSCHATYAFQGESTLCSCLNVKERLAQSRREIWSLSDCTWTRTQNHLVRKRTLNQHSAKTDTQPKRTLTPVWPNGWVFVYELSGSGLESRCKPFFRKHSIWNRHALCYS